ncbi:MAG: hypothetical protein JNK30_06295 [Phenylobacterium sp.]|uniref:hypothetical protein n=1 Tax=Phenylobacterium sp. TaxID=1871053 RepID=UPI001A6291A1|nr:hypothetical protein [Phenylobacterium sp.]MBL8770976.1 hypothetical protein [Phenylobacterium sp.]
MRAFVGEDYPRLIRHNAVERPHYGYIVFHAADLARRLGLQKISVLEFGVAGGRGLLNLEHHADRVSKITGVGIEVYGFDTGMGLPPPEDYRDLPYIWQESNFKMDQEALKKRLTHAKLVLGLVKETVRDFVAKHDPAPIGAVSFDLDYYSSTRDALEILLVEPERRLPRIFAYLDDIYSSDLGHVTPRTGVPLALSEFNAAHPDHEVAQLTHLEFAYGPYRMWQRQIYSCSSFAHPRYNQDVVKADRQLRL